ncbi:hypothetical protein Hamer_G014085, partial [Homarus americanus]
MIAFRDWGQSEQLKNVKIISDVLFQVDPKQECKNEEKKCEVCSDPHSFSDQECPRWREECRITKVKHTKNLKYRDVLLRVRGSNKKVEQEQENNTNKT